MQNIKIILRLFLVGMASAVVFNVTAQKRAYDTTTVKLFDEVEAIQAAYYLTDHISFDANYYYEDVDSVTVRDSAFASYKMYGDKFRIIFDSMEVVQNDKYFCSIYHDSKIMLVQKPGSMAKQLMQIDVRDTLFQQLAMSGMTAVDSSGYSKIILQLDSDAPYNSYEIVYNKTTFHILYIKYSLKKDLNIESGKMINIFIAFGNYQTGAFTDSVFSTDNLFTVKSSKEILLGSSFSVDYEIINMLEQ